MMGADMAKQKHVHSDEQQNFNPRASIQILDSTKSSTTFEFVEQLRKELHQINNEINLCSDTRKVKIDSPLVLLVQNVTRIGTDIDAAISFLKDTKIPSKLVAIIVIHAKEQHALPKVLSRIKLNDERYDDYGLLADFGFYKGIIYDCLRKCEGVGSILSFIKEKETCTAMPSKGIKDRHVEKPLSSPKIPMEKVGYSNTKRDRNVEKPVPSQKMPMEKVEYSKTRKASIQILDSTETSTTVAFVEQLRKELQPNNIETDLCSDTRGIKIDTPLVLLVQNYTRIGTDIDAAISCLKDTKIPPKLVAIIVIHAKEQHALPKVSSKIRLNDERYDDYGLLADFGFYKGNIYDCSLKCKGVGSIISYIKEKVTYTPTPSKGSEDHFHTEDPAISPNMPLKKVRSSNSKRVQMLTPKFTDATVKFKKYLEKELQTDIDYCVKEDEYQHGVPIILPVQKMTYVEQDIVCALSELKDIPRQDVAVAVIHINKQHALEKVYTKIKLPNEDCDKLGLVVDFACNNNYVYDHQMNTDSLKQLSDFIQKRGEKGKHVE